MIVKDCCTAEELLESYLNGPRTLSNRLSAIILARSGASLFETLGPGSSANFDIMICAAHFIGDGHALHSTATELFGLLGSKESNDPDALFLDLEVILETEFATRCRSSTTNGLPESTESRLPFAACKLQHAATKVDFLCNESRLAVRTLYSVDRRKLFMSPNSIFQGSHVFPKMSSPMRKTLVQTTPFDEARTKAILKKCKSEGVTVSNAIFALCNIAWSRTMQHAQSCRVVNPQTSVRTSKPSLPTHSCTIPSDIAVCPPPLPDIPQSGLPSDEQFPASKLASLTPENNLGVDPRYSPTMMYTALNLRSYLTPSPSSSVWFLSIGYFNVVLPSFVGPTPASTFWRRARSVKAQSAGYVQSALLIGRTREMAKERAVRAKTFAKMDDEAAAARRGETTRQALGDSGEETSSPLEDSPPSVPTSSEPLALLPPRVSHEKAVALIGISLLGNLDATYKHASYPDIVLRALNTGSRQRRGGMLMFGYTFAGKLWFSLGWDSLGFQPGVVEEFWRLVLSGVDEFLLAQ